MTSYPTVRVDFQNRMLAVTLRPGEAAWTDQLDDAHLVDVDAEGNVVALDIMTLDNLKLDEMAARFGFPAQVDAIKAAIRNVMTPTTGATYFRPVVHGTLAADLSADAHTEGESSQTLVPPVAG